MQQARPRAALEEAVRAGAQQERALQRRDGAVDRPHRRERPEVAAFARARAAMLEDLRRPVVAGDQDIGERLVVAQQHVEARPQPLDQVGFEQQRLGLGRGRDELDRGGRGDHPLDARVVTGRPRVGRDALLDALGLADVEHLAGAHRACGRRRATTARAWRSAAAPRGRRASGPDAARLERQLLALGQRLLVVFLDELGRRIDVFARLRPCRSLSPRKHQFLESAPRSAPIVAW